MTTTLILNATLVNEGQVFQSDVLLDKNRIRRIDTDLQSYPADLIIDATGLHLLPGMIDDQVHFREPGLTQKGCIATESAAAVAGGITSYMEMPNVAPPTLNRHALADKFAIAAASSVANYSFYLGASVDNLDEIKAVDPSSVCGIKVFMGASTGNLLVDDPVALEQIFAHSPILIATHCEDGKVIAANLQRIQQQYGIDLPVQFHPLIRDAEACYASSAYAVSLAKKYRSQLHVLHLTTAKELALFSDLPLAQKHITAEVCVHHLRYCDEDYARLGNLLKCNPAVKSKADRDALRQALRDGRLDIIATDHAPHLLAEKQLPFMQAPAGLPLVQHALLSVLDLYHQGELTLAQVVQKTAHAPAQRFGVAERGFLREGYLADLVLVDLAQPTVVEEAQLLYKCGWSPQQGEVLQSTLISTFVNGARRFHQGQLQPLPTERWAQPQALKFIPKIIEDAGRPRWNRGN
jgi:dihydroorotase